jgi:aspartate aminotransferase
MESISNRVNSLSPSATIAMNQKSRDLQAKGVNVINLIFSPPII